MATVHQLQAVPKCYVVGGCIRDILLGVAPTDKDFVWVGATPSFLLEKGYKQVGQHFPVFLDEQGNEHALARKEKKVGVGYSGFTCQYDPSITLTEDLYRRDLTINAMAVRLEDYNKFASTADVNLVIDPYGGVKDILECRIKHVSEHFVEDPVRVLRACRFASKYHFVISPDTSEMLKKAFVELQYVPDERLWLEFTKSFSNTKPPALFLRLINLHAPVDSPLMLKAPLCMANSSNLHRVSAALFSLINNTLVDPAFSRFAAIVALCPGIIPDKNPHVPSAIFTVGRRAAALKAAYGDANKTALERVEALTSARLFSNDDTYQLRILISSMCHPVVWEQIQREVRVAKSINTAQIAQNADKSKIAQLICEARAEAVSKWWH